MALLRERLRRELTRRGRITFATFTRLALYAPGCGYYTAGSPRAGARGDFVTSPEAHPVFAALVARQVAECWELLGRPTPFTVVELGGGRGRFADDFWAAVEAERSPLAGVLQYCIVDPGSGPPGERWERRRRPPRHVEAGCVLANEVFDALPVHLVERQGGALREVYVVERDGRLAEELGPLSRPALRATVHGWGADLAEGQRVEVCLVANGLLERLARMLRRGYVLVFDYGALDWPAFVGRRPRGTLRTFAGHAPAGDPLARPGECDITYHVDFDALRAAARAAGFAEVGVTTQRAFLERLGWRAYMAALRAQVRGAEYDANAYALRYLVREDALGAFLVLGLAVGGAPGALAGFGGVQVGACGHRPLPALLARARAGDFPLPLLTPDHAPLWAARQPAVPDFGSLWADLQEAPEGDTH